MTDIIERLRAAVPTYEGVPIAWPCEVRSELLLEAAAGVERLTRERDEARTEVERLKKDLRQGFPIRYETSAGCLCPAGANMSCQNAFCPRRNPPGVTC